MNQAVLKALPTESKQHHMHVPLEALPPYGHSKVVLSFGIVGTELPRWDVSVEVLHYIESLLSENIGHFNIIFHANILAAYVCM